MTVSTSVKWAVSSMLGAPVLNGTAGSMIAVLDAFLVNGFGTKAVDNAQVTSGVCRLAITGTSAALDHSVIVLAGVTGGGAVLNGEQRVKAATANHVEFSCDLPDGSLTGTITFKIAPLGWEKVFTGASVAVYRSQDPSGTRMYLRVDDSSAISARVVGYEDMSGANTGVGAFPTSAQVVGGGYWPKAMAAGVESRAWTFVGDRRSFALHVHTASTSKGASGCVWGFGDFASLRSGDAYSCALFCASAEVAALTSAQTNALEYSGASVGAVYLPRSFTGLGSAVAARHGSESFAPADGVAGTVASVAVPQYPNGPGNSLVLSQKVLVEPSIALRGRVRGVHLPVQACHAAFAWLDTVDAAGDLAGRKLLAVKCGSPAGTASQGVLFLDITGPWS